MITFQFFDGCPNSTKTLSNLKEVLVELDIPESEIEIIEVPGLQEAEKIRFQGSPTILIDGVDIYSLRIPEDYSYTCRVYNFEGNRTGVIPKDFIREKIRKLRGNVA